MAGDPAEGFALHEKPVDVPHDLSLFRDDPDVIAFGARALRLQCLLFPAQSWIIMSNMMQQVIGRTASATFLAMARQGIFLIPAVFGLTALWGSIGIQLAQPVSDVVTLSCSVFLQLRVLRTLDRQKN